MNRKPVDVMLAAGVSSSHRQKSTRCNACPGFAKGGAGKTTLALHLAVAAHRPAFRWPSLISTLNPGMEVVRAAQGSSRAVVTSAEQLEHVKAQAAAGGLDLLIIDSAPHADRPALVAARPRI